MAASTSDQEARWPVNDEIIQPQPDPGTGQRLADDRVAALASWNFPEIVHEGGR